MAASGAAALAEAGAALISEPLALTEPSPEVTSMAMALSTGYNLTGLNEFQIIELTKGMGYFLTYWDVILFIATLVPFSVVGTLGNILIMIVVLWSKELRTVGNMFVFNLAISDLMITSFVNGINILGIFVGEQWFLDGRFDLCLYMVLVCNLACVGSLWNIGMIGVNRYVHICKHEWYHKIFSKYKTLGYCIIVWIISAAMAYVPGLLGFVTVRYDWKGFQCNFDRTYSYAFNLVFILVFFSLPLGGVFICYMMIFRHVYESKKRIAAMAGGDGKKSEMASKATRDSVRLAKTVFIIFLAFVAMYAPWSVIVAVDPDDTVPRWLYELSLVLCHGTSTINFILYGITNKQFRVAYVKLFRLEKCMPKSVVEGSSTTGGAHSSTTGETSVSATSAAAGEGK